MCVCVWCTSALLLVHMPPFNNIVSGIVQSKQVASVICWTGRISYRLSVFWFMYPLHCSTVVLIFYQKHIADFLQAEHLQVFKPSQALHLHTFSEIIRILYVAFFVAHFTECFTWLSLHNVTLLYSISQSGGVEMLSLLLSMMPAQKRLF